MGCRRGTIGQRLAAQGRVIGIEPAMMVCSDCRHPLDAGELRCSQCKWEVIRRGELNDYLRSADRQDPSIRSYIETYDTLALRNQTVPVESNRYVENLSERFAKAIGNIDGKDVCDVGSGRGYLIKHFLKQQPKSVTAIDIALPSLNEVVQRYNAIGVMANAEHLPFQDHFDVVAATDIIEHVLNVSNFLVTANWSLRMGGVLATRVPYLENMLYYSNYHGLPMHYTHIRTFDRKTFVELVKSFGFRIDRVVFDGFNPNYPNRFVKKWPWLNRFVQRELRKHFGGDDEVTRINPWLGRLLQSRSASSRQKSST
jgi:ubiquinone/menaquinone biosynthesis C-methylase UbiE